MVAGSHRDPGKGLATAEVGSVLEPSRRQPPHNNATQWIAIAACQASTAARLSGLTPATQLVNVTMKGTSSAGVPECSTPHAPAW